MHFIGVRSVVAGRSLMVVLLFPDIYVLSATLKSPRFSVVEQQSIIENAH